MHTENMCISLL